MRIRRSPLAAIALLLAVSAGAAAFGAVPADESAEESGAARPEAALPDADADAERAVAEVVNRPLAQFQVPPSAPPPKPDPAKPGAPPDPATATTPETGLDASVGRPRSLVGQLTYQYGYGSESSITYRRNSDLNRAVPDNVLFLTPQLNGIFVYRPTDWLEATLEAIAEVDIPVQQPETITLPSGQIQSDQPTKTSLVIDQAFVAVRRIIAPFEVSVGRRNYEDERHWLYDTSMDTVGVTLRSGLFRVDAFGGREVYKSTNLWPNQGQVKDRINTRVLYADYRGIEDVRLAAYTVYRDDLTRQSGRPRNIGMRALGRPSDEFNFWVDLAVTGGRDAVGNKFAGRGFDVGGTYRFLNLPLRPNVTLGYAFGSGDGNLNDSVNHTFLQTGLQSNEARFAGVSKFKYYGEALDPELSNLKILTVGLGFWPAPNVTVDLVYHRYRLDKIAEELSAPITAQMNQVELLVPNPDPAGDPIPVPQQSKQVGQGFDVVIGLRRVFGLQRLGIDLRMGWFFPGDAYQRNDGTDTDPLIRRADKTAAVVVKFWW